MSSVNIKRAIENIKSNTNVYTPIIEVIVNAIQAIDCLKINDGKVFIRIIRDSQLKFEGALQEIIGFKIEDNGVGFNQVHRDSFDTLYTDIKISEGGKGFGRFTCLKYFENVWIKSVFQDGESFFERSFIMGKANDIIVNENIKPSSLPKTGTVVFLDTLKKITIDKKIETIAKILVEKLLPYFIATDYICPQIFLLEENNSNAICLNDYLKNDSYDSIKEIFVKNNEFILRSTIGDEFFSIRIFKFYSPKNQKSKIGLVAHRREVSNSAIYKYVPEFEDEFFEKIHTERNEISKNYVIKIYVFGKYLDSHVSLERGGFEFQFEQDLLYGIGQLQIEKEAALIAKNVMGDHILSRQEKKKDRVHSYVDEQAPWHKELLVSINLEEFPYRPSDEEIEVRLQKEKFHRELVIKKDVNRILSEGSIESVKESVTDVVNKISGNSKNDLIHYIALRRTIIDLFEKSLKVNSDGTYYSEGVVHDIIFPRKGNSDATAFESHNLWLLDERLNFTSYVASDIPLNGSNSSRPDLLVYNKRVFFRGENEASNPITIFEFKKPQRDDFVNKSSKEDPVVQTIRYVNIIRNGECKTPDGRKVLVTENTPFYGFVVCDLTSKVEKWLEFEKNFKPMPDRLGWFQWLDNINLYIEVVSWDKILKDAKMRNQIFFQKLGIA